MLLRLGWRNLRRRGWRSALTVTMVAAGAFMVTFFVGMAEGTYREMIRLATRTYMGHFQVLSGDYQQKPTLFKNLKNAGALRQRLLQNPAVSAVSLRVEAPGLLSHGDQTIGAMLVGVEPEAEQRVTTVAGTLKQGRWLASGAAGRPVVLGAWAARRLRVKVGDEISYVGQAADGGIAAELFTVTGLFETQSEMDRALGFIRLGDAQTLLNMPGRVHRVVGVVHQLRDAAALSANFPVSPPVRLEDWRELMPELYRTIETDRKGDYLFHFILMVVVLLGVGNTMTMAVLERQKELAVLLAVGTTPAQLVGQTLAESAWISALGVGVGVALGAWANHWFGQVGFSLPTEPISFGGVTINRYYCANTVLGNVVFPFFIFIGGVLAGLSPALKAARLNPVEALRTA